MSSYTIATSVSKGRVFILQRSELEKRFDPFYYSSLNKLTILEKTKLPKKKLSDVAKLQRGKFSHRPRNDERFFGGAYPFIQTGEVVKASNNLGKIEFSQTLNELGLSVSKLFDEDVLLITIAANIGDTAILDFPACFPDSIVAIFPKKKEVSLKYLNVYFKFLKKYLENLAPSAAQKNLTIEQLAPTPVILPTINTQNKIVEIFDYYIEQKQNNEVEAEKLLKSIDDYLLKELGIKLPNPPENNLKSRMYTTFISELSGSRFDPFYHRQYFENIFKSIIDCTYKTNPLKKGISSLIKGIEVGSSEYISEGISFVRVADITDFGINVENADKKISTIKYRELKENYKPKIGELLYSKDGTIGFCVVVEKEQDYVLSSGILRINCSNDVDNYYLKYLLSSTLYKELANRVSIGTVIKHLTIEDWLNIPIPIPPLNKQKEIADHITNIRQQAQQLKDATKQLLQKASEEIEAILLG